MITLAEVLRQEGREKGRQEGRQEGLEQAITEARAEILRLARDRFGPVAGLENRLAATTSHTALMRLIVKASRAATADELLAAFD